MKNLKKLAKPLFLFVFVGAMSVTFSAVAADCCASNDKGCTDRLGTNYPFDRDGTPNCDPPVEV